MKKILISTLIVFVLVTALSFVTGTNPIAIGGEGGVSARECAVSSVASVAVGDDLTTEVVGATSRRAYARISVIDGETEPVFLSFDEGADATVDNGVILTATGTPSIEFGLNTDFPYTDEVDAITETASTTVSVTTCNY